MGALIVAGSLCFGLAIGLGVWGICSADEGSGWARYRTYMMSAVRKTERSCGLAWVPSFQLGAILVFGVIALVARQPGVLAGAAAVAVIPPLYVRRCHLQRGRLLEAQLDGLITLWANALTTSPNLGEALQSLMEHLSSPWKEEIELVIDETELGQSLELALERMVERLKIPGLDAVVLAALLGKRTGGDLPAILGSIAASLREMNRLRGVLLTKTAEGRNQAWVIGAMPVLLVLILQGLNPGWLAPLFSDPIGWIILAVAATLEVSAFLLVRKIMAVEM